jgi:hypothetical protein
VPDGTVKTRSARLGIGSVHDSNLTLHIGRDELSPRYILARTALPSPGNGPGVHGGTTAPRPARLRDRLPVVHGCTNLSDYLPAVDVRRGELPPYPGGYCATFTVASTPRQA